MWMGCSAQICYPSCFLCGAHQPTCVADMCDSLMFRGCSAQICHPSCFLCGALQPTCVASYVWFCEAMVKNAIDWAVQPTHASCSAHAASAVCSQASLFVPSFPCSFLFHWSSMLMYPFKKRWNRSLNFCNTFPGIWAAGVPLVQLLPICTTHPMKLSLPYVHARAGCMNLLCSAKCKSKWDFCTRDHKCWPFCKAWLASQL